MNHLVELSQVRSRESEAESHFRGIAIEKQFSIRSNLTGGLGGVSRQELSCVNAIAVTMVTCVPGLHSIAPSWRWRDRSTGVNRTLPLCGTTRSPRLCSEY